MQNINNFMFSMCIHTYKIFPFSHLTAQNNELITNFFLISFSWDLFLFIPGSFHCEVSVR